MVNLKFLPANAPGRPGKTILDALRQLRLNADIENVGTQGEYSSSSEEAYSDYERKAAGDTESGSSTSSDENEEGTKQGRIPWNETIPQPKSSRIMECKSPGTPEVGRAIKKPTTDSRKVAEEVKPNLAEVVLSRLRDWFTKDAAEVLFTKASHISVANTPPSPSAYEKRVVAFLSGGVPNTSQEHPSPEEQVTQLDIFLFAL